MTELVRTVRSGSVGLDLALGGGFRFVRRTHLADRESATVLIRGGPGTGKSVLAQDLALRLAAKLGGDVLYVCVEVLPSEVLAQRMGFEGFDSKYAVDLSHPVQRDPAATKPYLVLGMRDMKVDIDGVPDLGSMLLDLARIAAERGFLPKVVVVDSLSDGYVLGNSAPRQLVDGVCKLAVEQGWGLILIEEVADASVSNWAFSVDTVLSLGLAPATGGAQARREVLVTKHRFGSCEPGPHRLQIEPQRVRVIPPFSGYRNAVRDLELPLPAKDRSLRIPVVGKPPDWEAFRVPDDVGCCVLVEGDLEEKELAEIARLIGRTKADGATSSGQLITFELFERSYSPLSPTKTGFAVGTLDQFVDGQDWLEDVLTHLSSCRDEVARVRIGPVNRLDIYENAADLKRGISLFIDILSQRELVAILFGRGKSASPVIRADIVTDHWHAARKKGTAADESLTITAKTADGAVTFSPALGSPEQA